jgi:hypothetical protein
MADHAFATVLWLKRPQEAPQLPRHQLIANSYAGLVAGPALWQKFLSELDKLAAQDCDMEAAYNRLRYDLDAERLLMTRTLGDVNRFNQGTIYDIIQELKNEASRDPEGETQSGASDKDTGGNSEQQQSTKGEQEREAESEDSAAVIELRNVRFRLERIAQRASNTVTILAGALILIAICTALWVGLPLPISPSLDVIPGELAFTIRVLAIVGAFVILAGIVFGFTLGGGMKTYRERLKGWLLKKWLGRDLGLDDKDREP